MLVKTIAVPASGFSSTLSLLGLNVATPIGLAFSKGLTSSDIFDCFGTLDSAATDATNATSIGRVAGTAGGNLDPELIRKMLLWPYVILQRVSGTGAGNLELCGNQDTAPAVVSAALPAIGAYTTLMDLTAFGATVRIGTSRQQTISDIFDVYVANDSTINPAVTANAGAFYAGRIAGGGEASGLLASIVVQGFGYAFLKRVTGATAGNALAAGASEPLTAGTAAATPPVKGTFSAAASVVTAAAQFVPPSGLATSTTLNYGVLQANPGTVSRASFRWNGDAGNAGGQLATMVLLKNGAPVAGATSGAQGTDAGQHGADVTFAPVVLVTGDVLSVSFTPSALLTTPCTNVLAAVA